MQKQSSWIEIDAQALDHNIRMYKSLIGHALLAPVIKSNAYGHGLEIVARLCDQNKFVDYLCVVSLSEAFFLRSIGIKKPILVISIIDGSLEESIIQDIDIVVYDEKTVEELNLYGERLNKKARIHVKIDSGLSRLGLYYNEALALMQKIERLCFVQLRGIFTHLAESEAVDQTFTNYQVERFSQIKANKETFWHCACSAAIVANTSTHGNFVRLGIGLYGLWPSQENKKIAQVLHPDFSLHPVLTWKSRILQIKEVPAGAYIGYARTCQVNVASRIAIIPVGYWDGYDRGLSNKGVVMIKNQRAPILGRIAMNLSIINITGLDVSLDDEVIILGNYSGLTADNIAHHCDTINYEVVTRINPLLPRILKR